MKKHIILKISALLTLSGSAASLTLQAQETPVYTRGATHMENTLPPAPDAASKVRYVDVPVSHAQGLATLDIPFYTLQGRELSIPISLSYATSGIRMDEVAGVAGLGWTLNAGGCVTRTVMDMPDEFSNALFSHSMPSSSLLTKLENGVNDTETMNYLRDIVWHRKDTSLDRYSYSVCGLSGSFVIRDDGTVFHLSGDGVKITPTLASDGTIVSFTLVGPDGVTYLLAKTETGHHDGSGDQPFTPTSGEPDKWDATTSWLLTSVTSRSGLESAEFSYSTTQKWTRNVWAQTETASFKVGGGTEETSRSTADHFIADSYDVMVLDTIRLSGYTATFSYATGTGSCQHYATSSAGLENYPWRLTGISVSREDGSSTATAVASMTAGTARDSYDGRIVLNSLRFYRGSQLDDRWNFTYDTRTSTVSRYSQDWFGYYNGEDDSTPHTRGDTCPFTFSPSFNAITLTNGYPDPSKASYMSLQTADHDGAKTEFVYEGAAVSAAGTGLESLSIGVRVARIKVYDNGTVKRFRTFTYEDPYADGPSFPLPGMYTTTSCSLSQETIGSGSPIVYHNWTFGLHETPVTDGPSIRETRAFYGKVTEDVSASITIRPILRSEEDLTGDGLIGTVIGIESRPVSRTVRYFSMADMRPGETSTISRFPSYWSTDYSSDATRPTAIDPYTGIRDGYSDSSPAAPALLTRLEEYGSETGLTYTLLSATDFTYGSDLSRGTVLTDYRATQVMQRILYGNLQYDDIYHYPVRTHSSPGKNPTSVHRTEYHGSVTTGNYDECTVSTSYVTRSSLSVPVRVASESMTEDGVTRSLLYTYPDTWTGGGSWASPLSTAHALDLVLRKDFCISPSAAASAGVAAKSEITEYGSFSIGGSSRLMPSVHRELSAGVECWREEFRTRDCLGNVSSVRETGRPETALLWSWDGLHPAAVVENASMQEIVTAVGSQSAVDAITNASSPTSSQSTAIAALRSASALSDAHVTTFSWSPGIGLLSSADPAGVTTSYEYDSHHRLAYVRDRDGNAVSGYSYSLLNDGSGRLSVRSRSYRNAAGSSWSEDVRWFDTLGRGIEDIAVAAGRDASGGALDLVTAREGDYLLHDDVRVWLPYPASAATGGAFQTNAADSAASYHSSALAYYAKAYENSSRDRILSEALPGYDGLHATAHRRESLSVLPDYSWGSSGGVTQSGSRAAASLVKELTEAPDSLTRWSVKDHAGRILATASGSDAAAYYVYDDRDRLRAVVGGGIAVSDTLDMWRCSYDSMDRVSSKGAPGSQRESYGYYAITDASGNISPSGNLLRYRYRGSERTEYVYDAFGRVLTEKLKAGSAAEKVTVSNSYDSYPSSLSAIISSATGSGSWSGPAKGLKTSTTVAMTDGDGALTEGYATIVWLYDSKERPVWTITRYSDGSILKEQKAYDFSGNVVSDVAIHVHGGVTDVLTRGSSYDVRGRLSSQTGTLVVSGSTLASVSSAYGYDELGRPSGRTDSVSSGVTVSSEDSYTLQQWPAAHTVKRGSTVLYTETLGYDSAIPYGDISQLHNGLVSKRTDVWAFPNGASSTRTIGYVYDRSGRMIREHGPSSNVTFSYDARGNITSVGRGSGITETYNLSGDRLTGLAVTGESLKSFSYDSFGRMTSDGLDGVTVDYNCFDLPRKISTGGSTDVNYCYLADGTKVSALTASGSGLVYRGPFTYRRSAAGSLTLESAECAAGRLTASGAMLRVSDHLGSTLAVMRGSDGALYEASEYDAYGKRSSLTSAGSLPLPGGVTLRDRFTGKEDQTPDFGIGFTDFGARHYSPTLRRWLVPDPLADQYPGISPYAYCAGNPVSLVDTDGNAAHIVIGALIGGVVSGGIALYQGKTGREVLGAAVGGAITGAITAGTGGIAVAGDIAGNGALIIAKNALTGTLKGAAGGAIGSVAEQCISSGDIEVEETVKGSVSGAVAGLASSALGTVISSKGAKLIDDINIKYDSPSLRDAFYKEVKREYQNAGRVVSGKATMRQMNSAVNERIEVNKSADIIFVNGATATSNEVQEQVISLGADELTDKVYEKIKK